MSHLFQHSRVSKLGKLAIFVSLIIIHLFMLGILRWPADKHPPLTVPPRTGNEIRVTLIPQQVSIDQVPLPNMTRGRTHLPMYQHKCEDNPHYTGAGFIYNPGTGYVQEAAPGYPAYEAGLRVGDLLQSDPEVVDQTMTVRFLRTGRDTQIHTIKLTVAPVCFKEVRDI